VTDKGPPIDGVLPHPSSDANEMRRIFNRMGFNDQEVYTETFPNLKIVTLMGAHSMGLAHPEVSGYRGPWVSTVTEFNNVYYQNLVGDFDIKYTNVSVSDSVWQWQNEKFEMNMPADKALILDSEMLPIVKAYALDKTLFYRHFTLAYQKLQELGIDLSGSSYVNLKFESGTCPAGEESFAKTLRFSAKFSVEYLIDQTAQTIAFTCKITHDGWAGFGFGNGMLDGIDAYLFKKTLSGWTVESAITYGTTL
jgi:hypothetical protein